MRREYIRNGLDESSACADPFEQFRRWFSEAADSGLAEPNAMTLATATPEGRPSARTVLLKGYGEDGFIFYTGYESRKGAELEANPHAALLFYWGELERQVRIEGRASRLSESASDEYFASRPPGSRLSALASRQSQPVDSREELQRRVRDLEREYEGREVPRPPHWGGYRVRPESFEFWQGRENRLHDRLLYTMEGEGWRILRLQP